jgi:hypothetical protein
MGEQQQIAHEVVSEVNPEQGALKPAGGSQTKSAAAAAGSLLVAKMAQLPFQSTSPYGVEEPVGHAYSEVDEQDAEGGPYSQGTYGLPATQSHPSGATVVHKTAEPQPREETKTNRAQVVMLPDPAQLAARSARTGALKQSLTAQHGIRPRLYRSFFDNPQNEAQERFLVALPKVVAFLNQAFAAAGSSVRVSEAEVAANFLAESGIIVLDQNRTEQISGYTDVGIDTLVDRYQSLKRWLPAEVRALVEGGQKSVTTENEKHEKVTTLDDINLEQSLYANGAIFAAMKQQVATDFAARGINFSSLPPDGQMFWTTVYFNAGEGAGRKMLAQRGAEAYRQRWTGTDITTDHDHNPFFNSKMRQASFALLADGGGRSELSRDLPPVPRTPVALGDLLDEEKTLYASTIAPFVKSGDEPKDLSRYDAVLQKVGTEVGEDLLPEIQAHQYQLSAIRYYHAWVTKAVRYDNTTLQKSFAAVGLPLPPLDQMSRKQQLAAIALFEAKASDTEGSVMGRHVLERIKNITPF